jgi:hypothetical protein
MIPGTCEDRVEAGSESCEAIVRPTSDTNPRDPHDRFTTASLLWPIVAGMQTNEGTSAPARAWVVCTTVLTWAVFLQAVTAGRILTGDEWARDLHRTAAGLLFLVAVGSGVVALVRLRDRARGRRFGLMLVAIGVGLFVQHGLGTAAADGEDTLWIHVPLGVALVGLLAQARQFATRVGEPA